MKGPLSELVRRWREDANVLRHCGHERTATLCERHAEEMAAAWRDFQEEGLSVRQAAQESGYSESRLYRLVEAGCVRNVGKTRAPRIARRDVPKKPGKRSPELMRLERYAIADQLLRETTDIP